MSSYFTLARSNLRFLGFGFLLAFTSSAGQTYFIGIFGPEIRATFDLSHTQWGTVYMIGTLCSALLLPWSGGLIDRFPLRTYTVAVISGLSIACLTISIVPSVFFLVVAIFVLRQFGQGLTSHTSVTTMARYMDTGRGKAIAIASMGYSCGEAVLPFLAVVAIVALGWQQTYRIVAVLVLCTIPFLMLLLKGHARRHQAHIDNLAKETEQGGVTISKSRREMLGEFRFYLLLPALLAPSYISTAMFFHHLTLAETKNWSGLWVTGNYWLYALCAIFASLSSGPLIDRYTAVRVIPYYLVPMAIGLFLLVFAENPNWVMPYMMLIGVNAGMFFTTYSAIWPELYGTRYLGSIKSLVGALVVFASALGPVTIGLLLDKGYSFEQVLLFFISFCVVSTAFMISGLRRYR